MGIERGLSRQLTWHSSKVPPVLTRSSTMMTWRPRTSPSFSLTIRLSPSLTLVQITCPKCRDREGEREEGLRLEEASNEAHDWIVLHLLVEALPGPFIGKSNGDLDRER